MRKTTITTLLGVSGAVVVLSMAGAGSAQALDLRDDAHPTAQSDDINVMLGGIFVLDQGTPGRPGAWVADPRGELTCE